MSGKFSCSTKETIKGDVFLVKKPFQKQYLKRLFA
jgi:hypothetical protein